MSRIGPVSFPTLILCSRNEWESCSIWKGNPEVSSLPTPIFLQAMVWLLMVLLCMSMHPHLITTTDLWTLLLCLISPTNHNHTQRMRNIQVCSIWTLLFWINITCTLLVFMFYHTVWDVNSLTTVGYLPEVFIRLWIPSMVHIFTSARSQHWKLETFSVGSWPWTHPLISECSIVRALRPENAPLD